MSGDINKKCKRCKKKCKQPATCKIVNCPSFVDIDSPDSVEAPKPKKTRKKVDKK